MCGAKSAWLHSMCGAKSALLPSMCGAKSADLLRTWMGVMQNLLRTWKGAMQTLLRTWSGNIVSGTKKVLKFKCLLIFQKKNQTNVILGVYMIYVTREILIFMKFWLSLSNMLYHLYSWSIFNSVHKNTFVFNFQPFLGEESGCLYPTEPRTAAKGLT